MLLWHTLATYFRRKYGVRVQKIPLDAGATCPNRDGTLSARGCIFCNDSGSGSGMGLRGLDLRAQWDAWYTKYTTTDSDRLFMAYLQSFSNTYGPASRLAHLLEQVAALPGCRGIAVGTRPDCLDGEKLALLAGCGGAASSEATSTAESKPAESTAESAAADTTADGDETLTVWAWDPNFNIYALKQAEAIYQKDHPNFKLNIEENVYSDIETKLITAATSEDYSTLPDLFLMQDYSYHKMVANFPGIYTDLTDSGLDWDKFSGGKLADSTVDGHHYGLPFDNGASVMAVRSDMIENAGLTVDDFKDLTWSEFEEKAQKVVDANGVPMLTSSGGSELIIEMMQSAGASPVVDGEVKIADNAALKESLTVYKDMVDKGILAEYTDWDQYIASMNDGKAAGVINGCWIMSSVQAAADQSGKWAIVNMPKLDGIDGATNYANCGGASWAVSSNCKNTELAFDFLKSTFGSSVELYDDLLPNAGAISSYLPAAESDVYNQPSEFYGGQTVYKDIVEFAGKVPAFDCGAYYSDVRSALTDAVTNIVQNNADIDSEMQNAQDTVEFNIAG